jgi:hypothetical protein
MNINTVFPKLASCFAAPPLNLSKRFSIAKIQITDLLMDERQIEMQIIKGLSFLYQEARKVCEGDFWFVVDGMLCPNTLMLTLSTNVAFELDTDLLTYKLMHPDVVTLTL